MNDRSPSQLRLAESDEQVGAADAGSQVAPAPKRRRALVPALIAIAVAAAGVAWLLSTRGQESTDDAYLRVDETSVAPEVRGRIAQVLVHENQVVKAGDVLMALDAGDLEAQLTMARAELQAAQAGVQAAEASLRTLDAEERLASSNMRAVETAVGAAKANELRAASDQRRFERLVGQGAVAERDAELARTTALSAQAQADRSSDELTVSRDQAVLTHSRRAGLEASLALAQAAVAKAQAQVTLVQQDRARAAVRAPVAGIVAAFQARVGDYVQPNSRLLSIVPLDALYVEAYFKETQTGRMRVGQPVRVEVDALPGDSLRGVVESLAPWTGAQFSLLPFEPGSGNFTKIVQRLPVRIRLDPGQAALGHLRVGLSANVTVQVAH